MKTPLLFMLACSAAGLLFILFSPGLHRDSLIRQVKDDLDHSRQVLDLAGQSPADIDTYRPGSMDQAVIILDKEKFLATHPNLAATKTFQEALSEGSSISLSPDLAASGLHYRYAAILPGSDHVLFIQDRISQAGLLLDGTFFWTLTIVLILAGLACLSLLAQHRSWTGSIRLLRSRFETPDPASFVQAGSSGSPELPAVGLTTGLPRTENRVPGALEELGLAADRAFRRVSANQHLLEERNQDLIMLLESMDEGLMVTDKSMVVHRLNKFAAGLFDLEADLDRYLGKHIHELLRSDRIMAMLDASLAGLPCPSEEITLYNPRHMQFKVSIQVLQSPSSGEKRFLILFNDLTEIRRLEEVRKDFVANVSHELRTPITAIRGFAETMLDDDTGIPEDLVRFIRIIHRQSLRLEAIIQDLLSLSRLEQTGTGISRETVTARELVESAMEVCLPLADRKSTRIQVNAGTIYLDCNRALLEQALINLVNNAVLYCPEGSLIKLEIQQQGETVCLSVADNGPGIPVKDQARLFERFYRVEKARTRDSGGTGLGLAIVRHIAQAHGGSVELSSSLGSGSTFRILIPSRSGAGPQPA